MVVTIISPEVVVEFREQMQQHDIDVRSIS